jgi:hypothetical protein
MMNSFKILLTKLSALAVVSFTFSATSVSAAVTTIWDFTSAPEGVAGGAGYNGWTTVQGEGWLAGNGLEAAQVAGDGIDAYFGGINTTGSTIRAHDGAHATFIATSPAINFATVDAIDPVLEIDFHAGNGNQEGSADPLNRAAIIAGLTTNAGQKGVALLNLSTGNYDAVFFHTAQGGATQTTSLTLADLTGAGVSTTDNYQLDFYEDDDGSWGWTRLEEVRLDPNAVVAVPEPSALGLLGLVGLAFILRRRGRK